MQFRLPATSTLTANKPDIRGLLSRVRLGPLAIKVGVILAFTTCWLIVAVVRINNTAHDSVSLDGSSLIGLAGSAEQRQISGRDFQSVFGPGTQMLAFTAMSVAKTDSPLRAYGMITFFFCGASAILLAVTLLLCDRLTWKDCAVVYLFCFCLNLFFDVLDFRTAMLMATVALAYRIIAAETTRQLMMWSTLTGFACFYAQLVTFELGIYAADRRHRGGDRRFDFHSKHRRAACNRSDRGDDRRRKSGACRIFQMDIVELRNGIRLPELRAGDYPRAA